MFFLPANYYRIYIHLPSPVQSQRFPPSSPSYSRMKGGSGLEREKISGEILSSCLLETRRKYFTRCIIWLDVPSFRGIYDRARLRWTSISVQRSTSNSKFYPPSVIPVPCPRKYPPRRTRTCGARGGTCPLVTLQLEEICRQDVVGRTRGVSSNAVIRLRGSGNIGRHICDRVYRSAAQVVTRLDPAVLLRD